jgi:hypothetical protein
VVGRGEVIEVSGVEDDVVMAEEMDGEVFVGGERGGGGVWGVTEGGVPASFGVQELTVGVGAEFGLEVREIFFDAG